MKPDGFGDPLIDHLKAAAAKAFTYPGTYLNVD